jgi:hypothetical protein
MRQEPVSESDLRSLDRPRLYTIFAPLDADEPLPRELVMAERRHRTLGRWELAGALWLPALALILVVAGWGWISGALTMVLLVLTFGGLLAYALAGDRRRK